MAQLHELAQQQMRLLGAAHFTDKKHRKNPVPEPKKVPRPWVNHEEEEDQDPKDYTEDIPEAFWDDEDDPEDEEGE
jgi:hypothetical protein